MTGDSKLEKNIHEINNGTFGQKMSSKGKAYKQGAGIGLIAGVLAGLYFRRSLVMFGLIGVIGGGYIGYKIAEATETTLPFEKGESKDEDDKEKNNF